VRVLFVSNISAPRCGVASFGATWVDECQRRGLAVTAWDGHYPAIYEHPHLPANAAEFDVIHVNWHPVTLNHYAPEHFPPGVPLSLYLHDIPPWSTCPLWERAQHRWAAEPCAGCEELRYPAIADAERFEANVAELAANRLLGWTGVRGDGLEALRAWADAHGWTVSASPTEYFATQREEIHRLSQCTLNVLWYSASGRGKSLALMTAAAARRPILVNDSTMFDVLDRYPGAAYRWATDGQPYSLDTALARTTAVIQDVRYHPDLLADGESWSKAVPRLRATWESLCR
jgi:hypothetical protein